jgi:hypothetical protein
MSVWIHWWSVIRLLRPAFSRLQTVLWFATAVAGFSVRADMLGVISIVRALTPPTAARSTGSFSCLVQAASSDAPACTTPAYALSRSEEEAELNRTLTVQSVRQMP